MTIPMSSHSALHLINDDGPCGFTWNSVHIVQPGESKAPSCTCLSQTGAGSAFDFPGCIFGSFFLYFLMHFHRSCAVLVFSGVPGAPFSRFQVSQVRRSSRFQVPRCAVPDVFRCPGAPFITFSGVPGAARRPYSIFQVPCWGLKILLSGIGSHTSAPRLEVQNFNPILFPARRSPPPFI